MRLLKLPLLRIPDSAFPGGASVRATLDKTVRFLYLTALIVYVVWISAFVSFIDYTPFLYDGWMRFIALIDKYYVYGLCALLAFDSFVNGISYRKLLFGVIGLFVLFGLRDLFVDNTQLFFVWLILAYPKNLEVHTSVFVLSVSTALVSLATILFSLFGYIPDVTIFEHGVLRHSFGFNDPNTCAIWISSLIMASVYLLSRSWSWRKSLCAAGALLLVFCFTDGRAALLIGLLQIVTTALFSSEYPRKLKKAADRAVHFCAIWLFPLLCIVCFAGMPLLDGFSESGVYKIADTALSGRLSFFVDFIREHGYPLFGQQMVYVGWPDNAYLFIGVYDGLLVLAFLALLFVLFGRFLRKTNDYAMAIFFALLCVHMMTEVLLFIPVENFSVFALGAYLGTQKPSHDLLPNDGSTAESTKVPK